MSRGITFAAMVLGLVMAGAPARAAMIDNPDYVSWSKQKPGAKLTYETTVNMGTMTITQEVSQVLKSVAAEKVTVDVTTIINMGGMKQEQRATREVPAKIEETQYGLPPEIKGTIKKTGTATVKAAGEDYECEVWEYTGDASGTQATGKIWRSTKIPGGVVQTETNLQTPMGPGTAKMTLKAFTP